MYEKPHKDLNFGGGDFFMFTFALTQSKKNAGLYPTQFWVKPNHWIKLTLKMFIFGPQPSINISNTLPVTETLLNALVHTSFHVYFPYLNIFTPIKHFLVQQPTPA